MVDYYWTAVGSKAYSELNNDLIKDLNSINSFTYHMSEKNFSVNLLDGSFNLNGIIVSNPEFGSGAAVLYYKCKRRNGGVYAIIIGYQKNEKVYSITINYAGVELERQNL